MRQGGRPRDNEDMDNTGTLKSMWATRPVRLPSSQGSNAKVAGVAEGIGVRYRIDPTLVRIVFVAAALFGGGILAYLLCWILMPRYSVPKSPGELLLANIDGAAPGGATLKKEQRTGWWLVAGIAITSGSVGLLSEGIVDTSLWIVLALMAAAWFGLHARTPQPPQGLIAETPKDAPSVDLGAYTPAEGFAAPYTAPTPPEWDPLGAAPSLWHLPEPPKVSVEKQKSPWRWILIGAAALMVVAASVALTQASKTHPDFGDVNTTVSDASQLAATYETEAGDITLDLSGLQRLDADREIAVNNSLGDITITLPTKVPVVLNCSSDLGDVNCQPGKASGADSAHTLTITAHNDLGDVRATP